VSAAPAAVAPQSLLSDRLPSTGRTLEVLKARRGSSWEKLMALLVLSVVGSDRPGLTKALAAAVLSAGGNWLESHLSQLGGLYVGSVLVELEETQVEAMRAAVRSVDAQGLEVRIAPALAAGAHDARALDGEALQLDLVGQDRTGIVDQVTAVLTRLEANIETFRTWVSAGPHSGLPLFHMEARVRLPPELPAGRVQAALQEISAEIMVDIAVTAAQ
jgi:glycine cleavage system regulatory protein